jgi:HSP20 family protein
MLPVFKRSTSYVPATGSFWADDFLNRFLGEDVEWSLNPAVNIAESDNDFSVELAAPGLERDDLKIHVENRVLEISAEKKTSTETNKNKVLRREFNYSSFRRSFTLPESVDSDKISATHKNGVLTVTLPKREEAKVKPARTIDIS